MSAYANVRLASKRDWADLVRAMNVAQRRKTFSDLTDDEQATFLSSVDIDKRLNPDWYRKMSRDARATIFAADSDGTQVIILTYALFARYGHKERAS